MKHGKKPTREQRKLMQKWKVNAQDWLVEREPSMSCFSGTATSTIRPRLYRRE